MLRKALGKLYGSTGLAAFAAASYNVKVLCVQRFVRLLAYGSSMLILVQHLKALGNPESLIGLFMTLTLVGNVLLSIVLTAFADRLGRRRLLIIGSSFMAASGLVFVFCGSFPVLLLAAIFGMISPSGKDTGPFKAVEESIMSQLVPHEDRSGVFAWYYLLGALGTAVGALVCGWLIETLHTQQGWTLLAAYHFTFYIYFAMGVVKLILSLSLSRHCELEHEDAGEVQSGESRPLLQDDSNRDPKKGKRSKWLQPATLRLLVPFLLIFWLDQMGSGLVAPSWQSYYLWERFGMSEGDLGSVFMGRNLLSAFGNIAVVPVANRYGLVPAMLAGHIPSSIVVMILPIPHAVWAAVFLVLFRSPIYESDQVPRQAWLALILPPAERTAGLGIINVWRELAQGAGLGVAGVLAGSVGVGWSFVLGGGIKLVYDALLAAMFWNVETRATKGKHQSNGDAASAARGAAAQREGEGEEHRRREGQEDEEAPDGATKTTKP